MRFRQATNANNGCGRDRRLPASNLTTMYAANAMQRDSSVQPRQDPRKWQREGRDGAANAQPAQMIARRCAAATLRYHETIQVQTPTCELTNLGRSAGKLTTLETANDSMRLFDRQE
jgi:hypothetical protein